MPRSALLFALLILAAPPVRAVDRAPEDAPDEVEAPPSSSTDTAPGGEPDTSPSSVESHSGAPSSIAVPASKAGAPAGLAPGATKKPLVVPVAKSAAGSGGGVSVPQVMMYNCRMPNRKATVEAVLRRPGMAEALKRLCRNKTDWTFLNAAVDELRKTDKRWGYFCRRGKCGDPSHDVLSYYCGAGKARSGADNAVGVDFVVGSCYDPGDGANPGIGWGVFEQGNPVGTSAWTSRGRF